MIDRRNRAVMILLGLVLLGGGVLVLLLGTGAFGRHRSDLSILDGAVLRRWDHYGAASYAVVGAAAFVVCIVGLFLAAREWKRNGGRERTGGITFLTKLGERGQTTLRTPSLSHTLENDLMRLPDVRGARVGLFGESPAVELRSVLDVTDHVDLKSLPRRFDEALARFEQTVGYRPQPIQVTVRFRAGQRERQLE
jgi:hypothetical protein